MQADGRIGVAVVGEDELHRALAMALFDAALGALAEERHADWIEVELLRQWLVFDGGTSARRGYYDIHRDDPLPTRPGVRIRTAGFINGEPLGPAASKLRHLFAFHALQDCPPDVVVILVDTDGEPRLSHSAEQVRQFARTLDAPPLLVFGLPHRDAEGWLFAAPLPADEETTRRHQAACAVLSFDPTRQPERLTSHPNHASTDAKRVVRFVLLGEGDGLAPGHPASRAPNEEADALAARLAASLPRALTYYTCNLAPFIQDLMDTQALAFRDFLPEVRP